MVVRTNYMSPELIKHCDDVRGICDLLYRGAHKQDLLRAAEIHDIGKYYISSNVLNANRGLTITERMAIDMHSQYGYYEALANGENELVAQLILMHHGISKVSQANLLRSNLMELTRLFPYLMAADIYSAIRETRPYHKPGTHEDAVIVIRTIQDIPDEIKEQLKAMGNLNMIK